MTKNQKHAKQRKEIEKHENTAEEKKEKNAIKVRDLKPAKDPKAGYPPDPCGPGRQGSVSRMPTAVE